MPPRKTYPKRTERQMLNLLRARHSETGGNGQAFAFVEHVRNAASFDATRTIDALAWALWKSRGLTVDAFEIKCSRSDWLRELKEPAKAEAFAECVDRFWLVVADPTIVRVGELPDGWGLLVAQGEGDAAKLVQKSAAAMLREHLPARRGALRPLPPGMDRSFLASLMRAAVRVEEGERSRAIEAEVARRVEIGAPTMARDLEHERNRAERLERLIGAYSRASGVHLSEWTQEEDAIDIGAAVKVVLAGEEATSAARRRIERAAQGLRFAAESLEREAGIEQQEARHAF